MADINDSTKKTTKSLMGGLLSLLRGSNKDSEILGKNASDSEVLGGIYKLMVQKENLNRLDYEKRKNYAEEEESEQARRHAEIVKALTVRRKPAPKKAKAKKPFRLPTLPGRKPVPVPAKPSVPSGPKPGATAPVPSPGAPSGPKPGTPAQVPSPGAPSGPSAGEIARQQAARRAAEETARRQAAETAKETARKEAFRKAEREAEKKAKEEVERKAREEAVRKAQEEAARKTQEEAARKAREAAEAARKAREAADAAKKAKDAEDAAKKAREAEEAAKRAKDAADAAKRAREEADRKTREALARRETDRRRNDRTTEEEKGVRAANEAAKREADRKAREESARKAREELARKEADKRRNDRTTEEEKGVRAAGEAAKREADRRAREESARKAREEAARKSAERVERKPDQPPTAQPAAPSAPPSATRVPSVIAGVAAAATFGRIEASIIKSEQGVKSPADALSPNNNESRTKRGDFRSLSTPKVGAATPDTGALKSTSYGLFGINNIRAKDRKTGVIIPGSSTIDNFIKMFPGLGLPDPGDPTNPQQVKKFNEAWWDLAERNPQLLLKAQLEFLKKTFQDPVYSLIPEKFRGDEGMKLWFTDRAVQYGTNSFRGVLQYAKNARTVDEFLDLASEYDIQDKELESRFKGTVDRVGLEEFNKMKPGLKNRIRTRQKDAKEYSKKTAVPNASVNVSSLGNNLNEMSSNNSDIRRSMNAASSSSSTVIINQQNTVAGNATQQQNRDVVDDSSPYSRKSRA
jgi:hypothetical protein